MRPARSLLLVPANRQELLDHEAAHSADAMVLDLASTVPESEKERARPTVGARIAGNPGKRWWVRVNSTAPDLLAADLETTIGIANLEGIVLPHIHSADEILRAEELIGTIEARRGVALGSTDLVVQLDNAKAVFFAHELAAASPRILSLCFNGSQYGDLVTDLGAGWSIDGPELMYARQYALVASRAADMSCPLDGFFANVDDLDGLIRDTEVSRRLGYRGRMVIDPRQIEPVNRIYSPTREEVAYHQRVLDTLETAVAGGRASVTLEGKMIDYAHAATARSVIAQARELGVIS